MNIRINNEETVTKEKRGYTYFYYMENSEK